MSPSGPRHVGGGRHRYTRADSTAPLAPGKLRVRGIFVCEIVQGVPPGGFLLRQPTAPRQEVNGGSDHRQGNSTAAPAHARCARAARTGPGAGRALGHHRGLPEPAARHRHGLQGRSEGLPDRVDHLDHGRELRARSRRQAGARLRAHLGRLARRLPGLPPHQVRGSALRHGHPAARRRDQRRRVGRHPQVDPARAGRVLRDDRLPAVPRHQRAARGGPARARGVPVARPPGHLGVRRRSDPPG